MNAWNVSTQSTKASEGERERGRDGLASVKWVGLGYTLCRSRAEEPHVMVMSPEVSTINSTLVKRTLITVYILSRNKGMDGWTSLFYATTVST